MFSINQPLFLQKKLRLYIQIPNIYLGLGFKFGPQRIMDFAILSVVRGLNNVVTLSKPAAEISGNIGY
jgi:hypothetical protein